MASLLRPTMLRQVLNAKPAKRSITSIATSSLKTPASRAPARSAFVRDALPGASRVAAFHASGRQAILPPLPQRIAGTVNDSAKVPDPSYVHGSYHWTMERVMSAGLIPLTIAPFAAGSLHPLMDGIFCYAILIHSHIGFQSCIIDYLPEHRVPFWRKAFMWILNGATIIVGIGLYEFETNDVGVTEAIARVWRA